MIRLRASLAFVAVLALLEYTVFSKSFSLFFQGDALFYMSYRFRHWSDFFHALSHLDIANWYRPLASQTVPSVFYPWFGLDPYGYHWVVFVLFFATTCVLFLFLSQLTRNFIAAAAGTLFFSLHSMNVYVTYDFAFTPELFYASFYLLSCIAYLRSENSKRWYALSIVFFVLALMSKEAAVTLPANIALLTMLVLSERKKAVWSKLLPVLPFFAIFAGYYLYIVRHLKVGAGDYAIALHKDLFSRIEDSFLWAFNLARGRINYVVAAAALFVITYAVASLFGARSRFTILGVGWFLIALSPMLGIVGYFGPYYLFLPMAGVALIVGESFAWLQAIVARFNPKVAYAIVGIGLAPFIVEARRVARSEIYTNTALGYAGRIAENSAKSIKQAHPSIPRGATIYIINPDEPNLWRYYGISGLFRVLYDDDTIDVRYSSLGHTISDELRRNGKLVVMKYTNQTLVPADAATVTPAAEETFQYEPSTQFTMDVSPARIAAGTGSYTIRISGSANRDVELQYRFNEGPLAFITVHLNPAGETHFFVSNETKRGTYRFVGMRVIPDTKWFQVLGSITVTD
jgi:hypothetical protein